MLVVINFLLILLVFSSFFTVCLGCRNPRVFKLRNHMLDKIFSCDDYEWRISIFHTVSYDKMVYQFWKPIKPEAFFTDISFLK